jgi:hypothetical protein
MWSIKIKLAQEQEQRGPVFEILEKRLQCPADAA